MGPHGTPFALPLGRVLVVALLPTIRQPFEAVDDGRELGVQLTRGLQRGEYLGRGGVVSLTEPAAIRGHLALDEGAERLGDRSAGERDAEGLPVLVARPHAGLVVACTRRALSAGSSSAAASHEASVARARFGPRPRTRVYVAPTVQVCVLFWRLDLAGGWGSLGVAVGRSAWMRRKLRAAWKPSVLELRGASVLSGATGQRRDAGRQHAKCRFLWHALRDPGLALFV